MGRPIQLTAPSSPVRLPYHLQATAPGSIISFVTNDADLSRVVVEQTELFKITVSFGNVCSLIRWGNWIHAAPVVARGGGGVLAQRIDEFGWACCVQSWVLHLPAFHARACHEPLPPPTLPAPTCPACRSMPCFMSHASIPAEVRAARGLPNDLVRISGAWLACWLGAAPCSVCAQLEQGAGKGSAAKTQASAPACPCDWRLARPGSAAPPPRAPIGANPFFPPCFPLSVGIEDVEDLIADLDQAFKKAAAAAAAKGQQQAAGQSAYEP